MPIAYADPNSNNNTLWSSYDYTNISKVTRYSTSPSLGTLCAAYSSDTGEKQEYGFTNVGVGDYCYNVRIYYYYEDQTETNGMPVEVYLGGSWQTLSTNDVSNHSINWYYGDISGYFTQSDIDNLAVRFECVDNGDSPQIYLYQLYAEIYYNNSSPTRLGNVFNNRIFSNILTTNEEIKLC